MAKDKEDVSQEDLSKSHDEALAKAKEALDNANALKVQMEQEEARAREDAKIAAQAEKDKVLLNLIHDPLWTGFAQAALTGILSNPGTSSKTDVVAKTIEIANAMVRAIPREAK